MTAHIATATAAAATARSGSWWASIVAGLASLGAASDLARRAAFAQQLYELPDAELAKMGLARDRVLHHAFGPYLGL
jgi:hypothetical protein